MLHPRRSQALAMSLESFCPSIHHLRKYYPEIAGYQTLVTRSIDICRCNGLADLIEETQRDRAEPAARIFAGPLGIVDDILDDKSDQRAVVICFHCCDGLARVNPAELEI